MDKKLLQTICCLSTEELEKNLIQFLRGNGYKNIFHFEDNYIIAEGELPVCLIAHLDTVFSALPAYNEFLFDPEKKILWSPYGSGFDDRAGVTMIIQIINKGFRPSIIFTLGEEIGGQGASQITYKFKKCPFKKCNALIELDSMGEKDCVFYQCDNKDFKKYIESFGFEEAFGTFTDISIIAPHWGVAAVNLSIGYLDEHSHSERINIEWFENSLERICSILINSEQTKFYKYIPQVRQVFEFGNKYSCFFCGAPLKKKGYIKITEENGINFNCCEACYNEFYSNVKI